MYNINHSTIYNLIVPMSRYSSNQQVWEYKLGRKLNKKEKDIFFSYNYEIKCNDWVRNLHENAAKSNLYIPKLTNMDGNCIFESLEILGVCEDHEKMRKGIAHLLCIFKDHKNLFPNETRTLEQQFNDTNEIEYVMCNKEHTVYKYTYDVMCQDLASECSWTRLPVEIILMFISLVLNIKFEILSNKNHAYVYTINMAKDDAQVIHLGHLNEFHYLPLAQKTGNDDEEICPEYTKHYEIFHNWASYAEKNIKHSYNTHLDLCGESCD